jgi:hypothetical protein
MAATTGHSINTGPYGENTEIYSVDLQWQILLCKRQPGCSVFTSASKMRIKTDGSLFTSAVSG